MITSHLLEILLSPVMMFLLKVFCNLTSLIKEATCFPSSNPSRIDLTLTNQKTIYKLSNTFETGLSDYHKLISTVAKSGSF